jgi:hypothetical protein
LGTLGALSVIIAVVMAAEDCSASLIPDLG